MSEVYFCPSEIYFCVDEYNGIKLDGLKIIDIKCGDCLSGCMCSVTNDRNRYDKESKTIICKHYNSCLRTVLNKMPMYMLNDLKETVLCEMRGV